MAGLRKSLHHPVVGDGYGLVSPGDGAFYNLSHVADPVHVAHLCMAVKLHPLLGIGVRAQGAKVRDLFDPHHGGNRKLSVEFVHRGDPFELQESALFHTL